MTSARFHADAANPFSASGHEGSASSELSGGTLAGAWAISLVIHLAGLGAMVYIVFPFAPKPEATPPLPADVQIYGEVDGRIVAGRSAASVAPTTPTPPEADLTPVVPPPDAAHIAPRVSPSSGDGGNVGAWDVTGGGSNDLGLHILASSGSIAEAGFPVAGSGRGDGVGFGNGAGGLGEGQPNFFGAGQPARGVRSIVYVVDRSASMLDTFDYVQKELVRSISALRRSQKFHVIFFNAEEPLENPPSRLVNAVEAHRQQFFEFLQQVEPTGGTHPESALRRALELQPDLIYLLSDGIEFDSNLPLYLDEWNKERRTRIFTIAYLDPEGRRILESIAREHGGECKFVSEYDLP